MANLITFDGFINHLDATFTANGVGAITGPQVNQGLRYLAYAAFFLEKRAQLAVSLTGGAGANTVLFRDLGGTLEPLTTAGDRHVAVWRCYDPSGNNVDYNITDITVNGFNIIVPVNCTLDYAAFADQSGLPS